VRRTDVWFWILINALLGVYIAAENRKHGHRAGHRPTRPETPASTADGRLLPRPPDEERHEPTPHRRS